MTERAPAAAGFSALVATFRMAQRETGTFRALRVLSRANQTNGFDCPGCAWPDPGDRSAFEFCENGAKAILDEATTKRVTGDFFARHSVHELKGKEERWLNAQGRITTPVVLRPGATHYETVTYEQAYDLIAGELSSLEDPHQAAFYTSGRTSNEAAFAYQLFVRAFGTNNLPDCSNLCHESSGVALKETLGIGKGTVRLSDFEECDLIFVIGQNPGSNHPRMLTTLRQAKLRGATIVSVNPLIERGLVKFAHPQELEDLLSGGVDLADRLVRVRINGDLALFRGINKALLECGAVDRAFIDEFTQGFAEIESACAACPWDDIEQMSGIARAEIAEIARLVTANKRIICTWAMGLTQHENAVATIQEVSNFLLLTGNMGRPGAGACPVRGHSNVQGDRTMGIAPELPPDFAQNLEKEFDFTVPGARGLDTVGTIRALDRGEVRALVCLGGNFLSASPDTAQVARALEKADLTVHVSTKLNKSHVHPGKTAVILPCLARSERDSEGAFVSVENSMGVVHSSRGTLPPAHPDLRSEVRIVGELGERILSQRAARDASHTSVPRALVPGAVVLGTPRISVPHALSKFARDYDAVRDTIARVVPGFSGYNERVRDEGGFELENGPRVRNFTTPSGKAHFIASPLSRLEPRAGELVLMTVRSHDQFNTTVYSDDDRYRGIVGTRRILFLNPEDMRARAIESGQPLRITSRFGENTRVLEGLRAHAYDVPRGVAAAYFPEANPLFFLESVAVRSGTPTSKSVCIRVQALGN